MKPAGKRGVTVNELPEELYLEVTNRCNLRCRTCPQFFGMSEASADLTVERVAQIAAQLPRLKRAVLHGIGEPLLNPHLPQIVTLLKARGVHVLFNTNGTLLRPARIADLARAG